MRMDQERQALFSWMTDHGIWHLPLKGILLKELYPRKGMRQMADNDILFDENGREQVHSWFLKRGFEAEYYRQGNHDVYLKKPFYNFELHTALFYYTADPLFQEYYRDVKEHLLPVPGKEYEYCFGEEDFYVYMTAHNCKHYENGGTGLRTLLDVFVYLQAKGETLDWESNENIPSGRAKLHYLRKRLFPEPEFFQHYYPFFYRHRFLLPVGYLYRMIHQGITNRKRLFSEGKALRKL